MADDPGYGPVEDPLRRDEAENAPNDNPDVVIFCGQQQWTVTYQLLATWSLPLANATIKIEGSDERHLNLDQEDPSCIEALVRVISQGNYDAQAVLQSNGVAQPTLEDVLCLQARISIFADTYHAHTLIGLVSAHFYNAVYVRFPSAADMAAVARVVYTAPLATRSIRATIVGYIIARRLQFTTAQVIVDAMNDFPQFPIDIV